jgi:ADP-heptose:LPS heptosyltransferase
MGRDVFIVRKGHLGDVILTEPLARKLRANRTIVKLVTEYTHVASLLPTYHGVLPYSVYENGDFPPSSLVLRVAYEAHPELHYIDGFARSVGISLDDRLPIIKRGNIHPNASRYCLLAPHTSSWCRTMRTWDYSKYAQLASEIEVYFGIECISLEPSYTFVEMLALIEHCVFFVGNDSGPAIIAQAYERPAFILFGATDPTKMLFSPRAKAIQVDVGCNGCRQWNRNSPVECNTPLCMDAISVELVFEYLTYFHFDS